MNWPLTARPTAVPTSAPATKSENRWTPLLTIAAQAIAEQETYAAQLKGELVGFYSLRRGADRMDLENLWVLPRFRRRGIGRALFLHAVERARALGFAKLEIGSDPNAVKFYERMGARQIGTTYSELEGRPRELPVLVCEPTRRAVEDNHVFTTEDGTWC